MDIYERILAYVKATEQGQRRFWLSEDDMKVILVHKANQVDNALSEPLTEVLALFPDTT